MEDLKVGRGQTSETGSTGNSKNEGQSTMAERVGTKLGEV